MLTLESLARELVIALNDEQIVLSDRAAQSLGKLDEDLTAISKDRIDYAAQIAAARKHGIDQLEIDDEPLISNGSPNGLWVSAWLWIAYEDTLAND